MSDFSWGLFIVLAACAIFIALGVPLGPLLAFAIIAGLIAAYRYPYFTFYAAIGLVPFLGLTISIPTGELAIGKRAFGGSIDIAVAEVLLLALLIAWSFKIILLWVRRRDRNWKPRLPLVRTYAALFAAHLASAFSPLLPDRVLVMKFALRPVLFCYLAFVALPVNFIRSRRRLVAALSVMSGVGTLAALNGAVSLFFVDASSQFIRRAHPLPMFGIPALGDNHNLLAELMAVTVLLTLALALLVKRPQTRRLLHASAILQGAIGLLTFSRTVWIVFALQALFLAAFEYRDALRRHAASIVAAILIIVPLAFVMAGISNSIVAQSSNSTRVALLDIAIDVFETSPWLGGGAGTFVDRVGSAYVFRLEYGDPLDSHGFLQKLASETGVFGLLAFAAVCIEFAWLCRRALARMSHGPARRATLLLIAAAAGEVAYQCFNTNYWTGKMWLPIGLALAALNALGPPQGDNDPSSV